MKALAAAVIVLLITGCTVIQSTLVPNTGAPKPGVSAYFLPKASIRLQAFCDENKKVRLKYIDTVFYPDSDPFLFA